MAMDFFYKTAGAILAPFRYVYKEIEIAKEGLKENARDAASDVLKIVAMALSGLLFLLFGSLSVATAINFSSGSRWLGFAIVAGFYLTLAVGIYLWKHAITKRKKSVGTCDNPVAR